MMNETTSSDIDRIVRYIQLYYTPILVYLGSLGNCLSMCVFLGTKLRQSSSSVYLGALAISDTGALVSLFLNWLRLVNVELFHMWGFCQFFVYLTTLCSFLSVWFVMAFTVERFVAVKYPLHRQSVCTVARARCVVAALAVSGAIISCPVAWISEPRTRGNVTYCPCLVKQWEYFASVYNIVDTMLTFVLPFVLIVVLNTLIARAICRLVSIQRDLTIDSNNLQDGHSSSQGPRVGMSQTKITKMLLVVSSVFLCLNLPDYLMRLIAYIYYEKRPPPKYVILIQQVTNSLFDTNFGINFVLYCASGQNFRRALLHIFCRSKRKGSNTMTRAGNQGNQFVTECIPTNGLTARPRAILLREHWEACHQL